MDNAYSNVDPQDTSATEISEAELELRQRLEEAPLCPICGSEAGGVEPYRNPTGEFDDVFGGRYIAICSDCGLGHTFPRIAGEDLGRYYASSFAPAYSARVTRGDWPFFDERSLAQISLARLFADFQPGDAFVDLGPGVGISFFMAGQLLDSPKLFGVEMNEATIAMLGKNLPEVTITTTVGELPPLIGDTPVKICLTSHCLEHFNADEVPDAIREIYELMAPGGVLMAEVPHWDLRVWNRRVNDVPHISFFSVESLRRVIANAGFEIKLARSFGMPFTANKFFEVDRRKAFDPKLVKGAGLHTLMLANSPDNKPRHHGKLARVVAQKPL